MSCCSFVVLISTCISASDMPAFASRVQPQRKIVWLWIAARCMMSLAAVHLHVSTPALLLTVT